MMTRCGSIVGENTNNGAIKSLYAAISCTELTGLTEKKSFCTGRGKNFLGILCFPC